MSHDESIISHLYVACDFSVEWCEPLSLFNRDLLLFKTQQFFEEKKQASFFPSFSSIKPKLLSFQLLSSQFMRFLQLFANLDK